MNGYYKTYILGAKCTNANIIKITLGAVVSNFKNIQKKEIDGKRLRELDVRKKQ